MHKALCTILLIVVFVQTSCAQSTSSFDTSDSLRYLNIPERRENAMTGSAFVRQVTGMSIEERETAVVREILSGNVPSFSRKLRSLKVSQTIKEGTCDLIYFAACDYMAIGSDQDYLYIPLTPSTAQYLADILDCSLPTESMVDHIYANSEFTLVPQPIPPSEKMTSVPVFDQHSDSIKQQISLLEFDRSANDLIAGHKKDIILSNKIYDPEITGGRVVIYGWHKSETSPIQPAYNGHTARYADYSHGVRLISQTALLNGVPIPLEDILKDPVLSVLLSSEGVINKPHYPESKYLLQQEAGFKDYESRRE